MHLAHTQRMERRQQYFKRRCLHIPSKCILFSWEQSTQQCRWCSRYNYQNEIHNLYHTSKQLTSQVISLTLVLSNLSSFLSDQLLPIFHTAATVHSMPGAAHLTSTNSAQCKTFFSTYSFTDCRSMAECVWDLANSNRFCCYITQKNALEVPLFKKKTKKRNSLHLQTWQCIPGTEYAMQEENNDSVYVTFSHIVVVSKKAVVNFSCVRVLAHLQQDYSACLSAVDW